ncbi:hypothetical protein C8R43DRAFT_1205529 [Mycena crocata]|nr:hypothetical protein C8R43DRAFT_1205529 [Mycena crocata]
MDLGPDTPQDLFLPIFFFNLKPDRIPTMDQLDLFLPETLNDIMCAGLALGAVLQLRHGVDVALALWPRLWPWMDFICTYQQHLPLTETPVTNPFLRVKSFLVNFLRFTDRLLINPQAYEAVSSTVGFRRMIARADLVLHDLCRFMLAFPQGQQEAVDEMIEGAGGTVEDLTQLVVTYLQILITHPPNIADRHLYIRAALSFVNDADFHLPLPKEPLVLRLPMGPLGAAMVDEKVVHVLVDTLRHLLDNPGEEGEGALEDCLLMLGRILTTIPGYLYLSDAITGSDVQGPA